jgi:hypothetical protein
MNNLFKTLLVFVCSTSFVSAEAIIDYQFNDANGTNINTASQVGSGTGSWDFGGASTQTSSGIGALNYGYTQYYKFKDVDSGSAQSVYRTYTLDTALSTGTYVLEVNFSNWDLRQNWDPNNDSAQGKGVQFSLTDGTNYANVRFETQSTDGFRAVGSGAGATFTQVNGSAFDNALNRFSSTGGLLKIEANLDSGLWVAFANDNQGGEYKTVTSGSGLLSITGLRMNAMNPTVGSWGGAGSGQLTDPTKGGTAGDFLRIDSLTLTSVPEPSSFALLVGIFAFGSFMLCRRH